MNFKRLLKPILVILAILILTLSVSAGDLYSTYGQRIKVTIDHTKIDADLSWFPVTVFLTSSQGEKVFTEFDFDEDFDRIAFTSSDGVTQLYADCELFDISENKAIYHVSKTGWTVSSSTDTDIYLYYDNTAGHNTTYISKSGDTAAQSVWDSSFEAVYHMNDPDVTQTEAFSDNFEGGDLSNWTTAGSNWSIDSSIKYAGNYSAKCLVSSTDRVLNKSLGNTYPYFKYDLYFRTDNANGRYIISHSPSYSIVARAGHFVNGSTYKNLPIDTTFIADTWYHIEMYGIADTNTLIYYIDGEYKGSHQDISFTGTNRYSSAGAAEGGNMYLDNVNVYTYDVPPLTIIDSTSNANHGTKYGSTEATGQVGQGQDFDGTDDYIDVSADTSINIANDVTLSVLFKLDNNRTSATAGVENLLNKYGNYALEFPASDGALQYAYYDGYIGSWQRYKSDKVSWDAKTYFLANLVHDTTANKDYFYVDGSLDVERADSSTTTNTTYELNIGHHNKTNFIEGLIDEIRISSTNRSAAWIGATYDSLWDTLLTYGSEGTAPPASDTNVLFIFSNF